MFTYTPGGLVAVSGGRLAVLLDLPVDHELVGGVHATLAGPAPTVDDVLDVLVSLGLRTVTTFAIAEVADTGVRVVVRGDARAVAPGVFRVGIIRPTVNLEYAAVCTKTGSRVRLPSSSRILRGGNHKSHCAASPGDQTSRSAGSTRGCSARNRFTLSRNQRIDPVHPTRSASTVAGMSGVSANNSRTRGSNGVNDVAASLRTYLGDSSEATAFATVFLETPNRDAILAFGTPPAASFLINAQSSKVITLQSLKSAHFSSAVTAQSWSAVETSPPP